MQKAFSLKNGLKVLFIEDKNTDASAIGLSVGAGVYFEEPKKSGISHLLEHIIGRGGVNEEILRENIYKGGGIFEASTSIFKTYFYLTCLTKDFNNLFGQFVKGIFNPDFNDRDIKSAKESVLSELSYLEDVEPYLILREMSWQDAKLSKPVIGSRDTIYDLSLSDLKNYHSKHYTASNSTVVLLSSELPQVLLDSLENLATDGTFSTDKINVNVNKPSYRLLQERNLKSAVAISFPTKGFEGMHEGRHYFNLAAGALTELYISGLGSKGLIYDESWIWNVFPKNGDFLLFLDDIDHSHLLPTLKGLLGLIDVWSEMPFDEKRFDLMRKHKILDLKTHTSIAEKIVLLTKSFSSSEEVHTYEEAIKVYQSATYKETLKSFRETLLTKKPFIVVSTGVDSEEEVMEVEKFLEEYYKR
jgi:predicted Zn-dependent peptidase